MAASGTSTTNQDHALQVIKKYRNYVAMIVEPNIPDESKLKAAQEISENFEVIIVSPHYSTFLEFAIPRFIQFLRDGKPQFVAEGFVQQLRKLILEIIHRIPTNDHLRPHYKSILTAMFHLLELENEENVLVCLRIIIELHRQFRPPMQSEIQHFLHFVKNIYKELPNNIKSSFEVVQITETGYLPAEVNGGSTTTASTPGASALTSTTQVTKSSGEINTAGKSGQQQTAIPKAVTSLKVLAELPIIVVLLFQLYKQNVLGEIREFIPLIMKTIILQPSMQARNAPTFNKEVYVDFVAAQIKTLSFLAFIIRAYQEYVNNFSANMVGGMLGLFRYCPQEVAHLRKELLIAARHILVTDLRNRFVPHIDQLFDEDVLIGSGWTARESLRPLAYSTLADLVHHVRTHLPLHHLSLAVHLFSKNVHDASLPVSIQTMSCKLLLNLVEGIRKSDEQGAGREILMRMLEVFIRKFHSIAKHELPHIMAKCENKGESSSTKEQSAAESSSQNQSKQALSSLLQESESSSSKKPGESKITTFSAADCKSMVKTLVCGVKTITWGAGSCRDVGATTQPSSTEKRFLPQETPSFSRLLKYALQALDIYQVLASPNGTHYIRTPNSQQVRMKEEKEILEHFAGVFTMLNTSTFKEVFQENIEYLVERIHANFALQIIPNSFLANPHTSATFATILMQFLLNKLDEMGTNVESSNLYLKLFKLVFGSVSLFASENEQMLKPHLHEVVNRSMELACTSKEPYNYFLLLRALFRSIGGGNHDLLYQEFLPLLPNLLQGLNNLQSGVHRQYMKDLFVELCLTVPVRLSSLLPYLPMLMDPLVSALNGSQTLVSQGLRTLELCVDNLQPDFLYDHIQPVRAELFQALWKTLRNQSDSIAHVAFRVLGKFGGGNRRMLKEPQKLKYNDMDSIGPCISIYFPESNTPVTLPVSSVIESALTVLKAAPATAPPSTTTQPQPASSNVAEHTTFYRKQAWLIIQSFLVTMISFEDSAVVFEQLLSHPCFKTDTPPITGKTALPASVDEATKQTLKNSLLGMLVASSVTDIKSDVIPFLCNIVRHYTILCVVQQAGPCASKPSASPQGADVHVLIDAISSVMMLEEKDLCKTGELAIAVMRETAFIIMGDLYKALQLPLFEYLVEKLCGCCYERAWFAKAGGCSSIVFLMKTMPLKWIIEHQLSFVYALMFVMMDLTDEVSAGTVDLAKEILEKLIRQCNTQNEKDEEITAVQKRCFPAVVQHLVREVISSNNVVREQAQYSLSVLSHITGKSVHDIMEPHKGVLEDMMPPKKHLLRHQPVNMQIALMDGNTFCTTLQPRLFTMDLNVIEHKVFFKELLFLCEADDTQLQKLPCYKLIQNFTILRTKALHALAAYHYISQVRDAIFNSLYKALNSNVTDVQKAGNEALKKFLAGGPTVETETVQQTIRPLFLMLGDHRVLNLHILKRLSFLMELFPQLFNEKLCEQLLTHLKNLVELCVNTANQIQQGAKPAKKMEDVIDICIAIMDIFHLMPAASAKLIEPLIQMVLKVENFLLSSSFRKPLLKFLIHFPSQTVDYFLLHISDSHISRLFVYFLQQEDAKPLRKAIEANPLKLVNSTFLGTQSQAEEQAASLPIKLELQFQGILIVRLLVKFNDDWLSHHRVLVGHLKRIWTSEGFQDSIKKDGVPVHRWREPKLLVKCLLNYVKHRPIEVELLFQLLRVFTHRHIPDFQFLKTFMEEDVAKKYTVEQKRAVFFKFVEIVHNENFPQDLTAKALQYIIIPMFVASFEKGSSETDSIIGGPPNPEQDSGENVISVFVSRVIDPENPFKTSDAVRILLLQFSALLFEHASQHIHDAANKKQGTKLRRMMTFAWPCLLPNKQCVDPATKYHGHLLLAHIISKFAIHKRIVIQVFHSLLKAHAAEARNVVRQALGILTPAVPARMEDGNAMLTHWTKKIIVEDGHTLPQLVHMLQLLVRHYKVYYPVRGHLIQHMITAMQKLGFTSSPTIEHRKLAVDLANVIIEWEIQRNKDELQQEATEVKTEEKENPSSCVKRTAEESSQEPAKRVKTSAQGSSQKDGAQSSQHRTQVDKHHADAVVNFLLRVACQVNEATTTVGSPGEALSKRCVLLLKTALKPGFWQGTDLKLTWLDTLFVQLDQTPGTNFNNVCTGLEILTYLLTVLSRMEILPLLKRLQRGIVACMACQNTKVIRAVHSFLAKLMSLFPIESATMTAKYEELEQLYTGLGKIIYEGLTNYAKSASQGATSTLQGPLMFLKAAYSSSPSYIDRLINPCIRALQKMHKDHISGSPGEMLVTCVDLVKSRLGAMDGEARKLFIAILAQLIEKSPDAKLLKAITKVTEEWIKAKVTPHNPHLPTLREKAILLCRMMPNYEKRFPEDFELHAQYLELINYVYRDDSLLATELAAKLEPAFMSGLKCVQPQIRSRFMEVFDQSISKKLYERLLYIFCSQNWESMKSHFWIKQCVELLLAAAVCDRPLNLSSTFNKFPSLLSMLKLSRKPEAKEILENVMKESSDGGKLKEEPMDTDAEQESKSCDQDNFLFTKESSEKILSLVEDSAFPWNVQSAESSATLMVLAKKHQEFLAQQKSVKSTPFLGALAQLCHNDTQLAHNVWVNLFPQLWSLLRDKQQQILAGELSPFMCSGTNCVQLDSHPSVVHTILESISHCEPSIPIRPSILKYLGKSHNQWHLSTLILEDYVTLCEEYVNPPLLHQQQQFIESIYEEDTSDVNPQETLDSLAEMYSLLNEEDMWAGLWLRRARFPETATAIAYETQGFFEQAQSAYELAMTKARDEHTRAPASAHVLPEYKLWEDHWIKCSQELGQWDLLMEFGKSKGSNNPFLVLESAWRVPDWPSMKEALAQVEKSFPDSILYKLDLYRAYIEICNPEDQHLKVAEVEKLVETSSAQAIRLWKRLPDIISHQHVSFLQASQQIVELQEAAQIRAGIQPQHVGRNASLHDMKAIIKTWKNRLPMISDNLNHWSDIFLWRHHHYEAIIGAYDAQHDQTSHSTNHSMLGVHASAWSIIHYGQVARKQSLTGVCLDSLSRIHTIPSVPIVDCFQKIRQQVKCYLQMAGTMRKQELQEGLEVIESTNLKYFSKEMTAEFYALKGTFLAQIGRSDDANKAFSQAVQMHDSLIKGWALWGDYLDTIFVKERTMSLGVSAIICYMHASRNPNEAKCRKFLARTIWLLTYDDEKSSLAEALDKYCVGVPPVHWLPWVPQLLTCLIRKEGSKISSLLMQIGRVHAQAIYFPIRTLYLTLKLEHREKYKLETGSAHKGSSSKPNSVSTPTTSSAPTTPLTPSTPGISVSSTTAASIEIKKEPVQAPTATSTPVDSTSVIAAAVTVAKTTLPVGGGAVSLPNSDGSAETLTRKPSSGTKPGEATVTTPASTTQGALGSSQSGAEPGSMRVTTPMWLCSRIMHALRELHPTLLAALEGIVDQMVWFRECWHEEVLRQLRQVLTKCYQVAFETRTDVSTAKITPHTMSFVKKLVSTFGVGFEFGTSVSQTFASSASESLARRAHATAQDPMFQKMKEQFTADFDFSTPNSMGLHNLITKLKKWIKILEAKTKLLSSSFLLEERCRFLSVFSIATADVELPGEFLMPKPNMHSQYYIRIAQFMPRVELVQKQNMSARRLFIRANNGKIYPYLVMNDVCLSNSRREERVLQLLRILNLYFEKRKESSKRHLLFTVPRVVAVSPQMRLIEDNPSAVTLKEVLKMHYDKKGIEEDSPVSLYYERLAAVQARGEQSTHQVLRDIFKEIQSTIVPEVILKEWAQRSYQSSADYWTFRKQFTAQLTLSQFAEFTLHLSRLSSEMLQIVRETGRLTVAYYKFEIDDSKGELDANRPVPFRLTPNISELISPVGIGGVLTSSMVAAARCLVSPKFSIDSILRAILRDEIIAWHKKKYDAQLHSNGQPSSEQIDNEVLITLVNGAVNSIMTRLQNLAEFEGAETKVTTLIGAAMSPDNLCRMDPAWHPWL